MSLTSRIDKLQRHYPRPSLTAAPKNGADQFDLSRLTLEEQYEFDQLVGAVQDRSADPDGRLDPSVLTTAEATRFDELLQRLEGLP